jgi:hypothetical protein
MSLSKDFIQNQADSFAKKDPYRVILCCKVLEFLSEHDLKTLYPSFDLWVEELERQINAGEGDDFPRQGNVRLENITHLISGLEALIHV